MSIADADGSYMKAEDAASFQDVKYSKQPLLLDCPSSQTSKKRKRDAADRVLQLRWEPFSIRGVSNFTLNSDSEIYSPRFLLPRSSLPLAFLDVTTDGPDSRLFAANIDTLKVLEQPEIREATVLIAQANLDNILYAIERVQKGLYALCRLGKWVTQQALQKISRVTQAGAPRKVEYKASAVSAGSEWWLRAATDKTSQAMNPRWVPRKTLPLKRPNFDFSRRLRNSCESPPTSLIAPPDETEKPDETVESVPGRVFQEPEEVLDLLRSQYQEALYVSKTPLAYFAKGPVPRARTYFRSLDGSPRDCSHFAARLRSLIIPLTTVDKKYRETIPHLVKGLPFSAASDDDGTSVLAPMTKVRKSKKTTIGKNGLYPGEDSSITQWWMNKDLSNIACDTVEAREEYIRGMLLDQRSRETQLQIILVLEILSIEASSSGFHVPEGVSETQARTKEDSTRMTGKPRTLQNLDTHLDLLVDRLGIWQSMATDENKPSGDQQTSISQYDKNVMSAANANHLQDFCVDVVIPFYHTRLPGKAVLLCQKLGNSKDPSPKRPPPVKSAGANCSSAKPDGVTSHQPRRKPRKILERVLTDGDPGSRKNTPSLSRSATEPTLPQMKRQVSDTCLWSIPLNKVAMSKRYNQREVDLRAASQATEAKMKKKASIEQELRGAIAALKKPNPRMAVKELVEATEKRAAGPHSRKPKNPMRNAFAQSVQIMMTPRKNQESDASAGLRALPQAIESLNAEIDEILPSSVSKVPCSAMKASGSSTMGPRFSTDNLKNTFNNTEQTPSRGPSKFLGRPSSSCAASGLTSKTPLASSLPRMTSEVAPRDTYDPPMLPMLRTRIHATPSKVYRHVHDIHKSPQGESGTTATPVQVQRVADAVEHASPRQPTPNQKPDDVLPLRDDYVDELL